MSERDDYWLESLPRAIEVTEGQIAIAKTVKVDSIAVQVDRVEVLIKGIRDLQRRVAELEQRK